MTIDEAINHLDECIPQIRAKGCEECAQEHEQLKLWLEELVALQKAQIGPGLDGRGERNLKAQEGKKILDVTCGSRTIWFDKHHPAALYCDRRQETDTRIWKSRDGLSERHLTVAPDVVCDFTDLPFPDCSFSLVVWDPPHLLHVGESSWLAAKYGKLDKGWPQMLKDGFKECMRVLKPDGVLIFKWAESDIPANEVWRAIGQKPLFGHHSGKRSGTFWGCYMKLE